MKNRDYLSRQHLELFPASLLTKRQRWQHLTVHVPAHSVVLIARLGDPAQTGFMQGLGYALQKQGRRVFVLSV